MSEEHQASILAQWLDATAGTPPPEDLNEEILGAIYALRPDRAPPHRVQLEHILGSLVEGPVADPAVAAAAISLNPDRAPAHRVGIDEILDSVTSGPFAEQAPVVDLAQARRRRQRWVTAGAIAAAAMALFVVMPISDKAEMAPSAQIAENAAAPQKEAKRAKRAKRAPNKTAQRTSIQKKTESLSREAQPDLEAMPRPERATKDRRKERPHLPAPAAQPSPEPRSGQASESFAISSAAQRVSIPPHNSGVVDADEPAGSIGTADTSARGRRADGMNRKARRAEGSVAASSAESHGSPSSAQEYPDTTAYRQAIHAARALIQSNPEQALRNIQSAHRRYRRVHPRHKRLGYLQEARALQALGRHDEAEAAKKKARDIESAN